MFAKLSQFKTFVSHVVTSLQSQKPTGPTDPELDQKLHFLMEHVINEPVATQFKAYHELQHPELELNETLGRIYSDPTVPTQHVITIIRFYSFLLLNCAN